MHPEGCPGVGAVGAGFHLDGELGVLDGAFVWIRQQLHLQGGVGWQAI
jgi:hypothetical protein